MSMETTGQSQTRPGQPARIASASLQVDVLRGHLTEEYAVEIERLRNLCKKLQEELDRK
jgi:hypothetical protein